MTAPPTTVAPSRTVASPVAALVDARAVAQVPLPRRPRRQVVRRPPTQRAASRALRRTSTPTTGRTWLRSRLPQPERASAGVPVAESVATCTALALLFVPVALWVGLVPAVVAGAIAVGALSYLLGVRRVVVGDGYVAVRQLGRFHVATVDHVRHLELKPTDRGGVLCVHTDDGRCMRLRRAELADPGVGAGLRALVAAGGGTHDPHVATLLDLPLDPGRLRDRYLADGTA
jgi:hypothetical protein